MCPTRLLLPFVNETSSSGSAFIRVPTKAGAFFGFHCRAVTWPSRLVVKWMAASTG